MRVRSEHDGKALSQFDDALQYSRSKSARKHSESIRSLLEFYLQII
jgi:hypothetical protein